MNCRKCVALACVAAGVLLASSKASAVPVTWTVVSSASSISLSMPNQTITITSSSPFTSSFTGLTSISVSFRALNPGTASASTPTGWTIGNKQNVSGYFATDTDYISSIKFLGGAQNITKVDGIDSGSYAPLADGSPGTASADFGVRIFGGGTVLIFFSGTANVDVAFRDMIYDATSGVIPIAGGSFDSNLVTTGSYAGADLAYRARDGGGTLGSTFVGLIGSGAATLPATGTLSSGAAAGSIVITPKVGGDIATLTLPIKIPVEIPLDDDGLVKFKANITGTLVGTLVVPEPTAWMLAAVGLAMLSPLAVMRRLKKRRL